MKLKSVIALALVICLICFAGCTPSTVSNAPLSAGGVLCLRVNPEIAVHFDEDGNVTKVEARNDDGSAITENYTGYEGSPAEQVIVDLVTAIGEAGYFVEEIEGQGRQITLEIEPGSKLPSDTFLIELADAVQQCINSNAWTAPVDVEPSRDAAHDGICTNPYCDDPDCDDLYCDDGICTNPHCDDADCDDLYCDDGICTNPYCDDSDCDDIDCNDYDLIIDDQDDGICTNPYCDDADCDDLYCDDGVCTNPYCDDDDCDDADCDEDADDHHDHDD